MRINYMNDSTQRRGDAGEGVGSFDILRVFALSF